jgi:hypothetical protein
MVLSRIFLIGDSGLMSVGGNWRICGYGQTLGWLAAATVQEKWIRLSAGAKIDSLTRNENSLTKRGMFERARCQARLFVQFLEQRLGVLQVGGVEALGEPTEVVVTRSIYRARFPVPKFPSWPP